MITFLSSPKPFTGIADKIQRNAIRTWKTVHPEAEVIIYGEGQGVAEVCTEMGLKHVPDVPCSPSGVPFFNGIVEHAALHARHDRQCYLNGDILLLPGNMPNAIRNITFDKYLITGQRFDLLEGVEIDVTRKEWSDEFLGVVTNGKAVLHSPTGNDYFIFKRGMWKSLLPLVIGRGGYDEALILFCLRNRIPLINATLSIIAVHQFHDYGHQKGGKQSVMRGEDAQMNIKVHRNFHSNPNSADAPWLLVDGGLVKNSIQRGLLRRIEHYFRFGLGMERFSLLFRILWRILAAVGMARPKWFSLEDIPGLTKNKPQE